MPGGTTEWLDRAGETRQAEGRTGIIAALVHTYTAAREAEAFITSSAATFPRKLFGAILPLAVAVSVRTQVTRERQPDINERREPLITKDEQPPPRKRHQLKLQTGSGNIKNRFSFLAC